MQTLNFSCAYFFLTVLFLQALDQLFEARKILGFSYVFAFFMFGDVMFKDEITPAQNEINKNLFENQQQAMESLVSLSLPDVTSPNSSQIFQQNLKIPPE